MQSPGNSRPAPYTLEPFRLPYLHHSLFISTIFSPGASLIGCRQILSPFPASRQNCHMDIKSVICNNNDDSQGNTGGFTLVIVPPGEFVLSYMIP